MAKILLADYADRLADPALPRELGERLWERDAELDLSGVDSLPEEFIRQLLRVILERRDQASLMGILLFESMPPHVSAAFFQASLAVNSSAAPMPQQPVVSPPVVVPPMPAPEADEPADGAMNPFDVLRSVQQDYLSYVRTFQIFQNPDIQAWVLERIQNGSLLWKPPFIQLARPFAAGEELSALVQEGLLHPHVPHILRRNPADETSAPIRPHLHQTQAVRKIVQGKNVVVATGTGSGKSFAFGIPIISDALKRHSEGVHGIQAVIVYPMNALANSQYDEFTSRLKGTGLRLALYTGDTQTDPAVALHAYRQATGRELPYDCEVISRNEIHANPPDILMTNYVMLELLLTRFEDKVLFGQPGVLRYLVLDEVHTYRGSRGADVAALIRRLKQHTGTIGKLRCIGTSATVESSTEGEAARTIARFASELFGEPFDAQDVVTETYAPFPESMPAEDLSLVTAITRSGPRSIGEIGEELGKTPAEVEAMLMGMHAMPPKLHSFFSQGRAISACLDAQRPHLNDRGERECPVCADENRDRPTFMMVFCRACGQDYYSVDWHEDGHLGTAELDSVDNKGTLGYLLLKEWDEATVPLPEDWFTPTGKHRQSFADVRPIRGEVCQTCGTFEANGHPLDLCTHEKIAAVFFPAPFLFCPSCGITHDRRSREFNKLFTFGSVGRSTATDVLVSAQVRTLPKLQAKVIAFSDNRQDTALQSAHMNSLHKRFAFRRGLFQALLRLEALSGSEKSATLRQMGRAIYETLDAAHQLPDYHGDKSKYGRDPRMEEHYQDYLQFLALQELRGTHKRTHQNLEDVGLLHITYRGLPEFAADDPAWIDIPEMADVSAAKRLDVLQGLLDLMRKRLAIHHPYILNPGTFRDDVLDSLNREVLVHDEEFFGPIGYSDDAEPGRGYTAYRLTGTNTQLVGWIKRTLNVDGKRSRELVTSLVAKMTDPTVGFLVNHTVHHFQISYTLVMVPADRIQLQADQASSHRICPKCLTVHRFTEVDQCTGAICKTTLMTKELVENYFRQMYTLTLDKAVPIHSEEHSGQVSGEKRRKIELDFRDAANALNCLVCTPTMELGIDIGHLSAVMMRNVPPNPSNYAQRSGRAGRSGQPSLITVFAGVGASRGPHDQYFYRFPEKMISGSIVAPRFRLDNKYLMTAHIHALVFEVVGIKLPNSMGELLDMDGDGYPIYDDFADGLKKALEQQRERIVQAVMAAFAEEAKSMEWLNREFVTRVVDRFLDDFDLTIDRWRGEYTRLDEERAVLNQILGREQTNVSLSRRRGFIERKMDAMRSGKEGWYIYRYLGMQGFLPSYAFPREIVILEVDGNDSDLARDPSIALSEYAPGNFIYYAGERYEVTHGRPRTKQNALDTEPVLICPACQRSYVGSLAKIAKCDCGQDLTTLHPHDGLKMCDMYAVQRSHITADEEERTRLGFQITTHYHKGGQGRTYAIQVGSDLQFQLVEEKDGEIMVVNHGQRQPKMAEAGGFSICRKCNAWLIGDKAIETHLSDASSKCRNGAHVEDIAKDIWLTHRFQSDLIIFDVPLPQRVDANVFYTTLLHTLLRGIMVAFQLDESEISGFLVPHSDRPGESRVVLYENSLGGTGVLAALKEPDRLKALVGRMRELLHEGDPEGGCERACYDCLLSFYNQRDHGNIDRVVVLNWLKTLDGFEIISAQPRDDEKLAILLEQCQSDFERNVLRDIAAKDIRMPDETQKTIYDNDGVPLAIADFFYTPKLILFVDGSPHYQDYVRAADESKRKRLKGLGYRMIVIRSDGLVDGIRELSEVIG